jgi:hypothetical protein
MKKISFITLSSALALCSATSTYAHHSNAPHFDTSVDISVEAAVTKWEFVNPHAYIFFQGTDANGETAEWRCESSSATNMGRRGFDEDTFYAGQNLTIVGNPARREDNVCFVTSFVFEDGTVIGGRDTLPEDKRSGAIVETVAATDLERSEFLENGQPNISGAWVRAGRGGPPAAPSEGAAAGPRAEGPGAGGGGPRGPQIDSTEAALAVQANYEQIYDDPSIHCDIGNIFFGWTHDSHVNSIAQEDDKVILQYGYMDYVRTIHLDMDEHPADVTPSRGGHSIGYWEESTLVVDSIGFLPGVLHPLSGVPHSDQMHATERFWYNQETKTLKGTYSAADPLYLNSAYTGQTDMNISAVPYEPYNCTEFSGDNNRRPEDRIGR